MIIHFGGKVSDMFYMSVDDKDGNELIEHDGYVPSGLGLGGGDYIELAIDNDTGHIVGWKTLDLADIKTALGDED